MRRRYSVTDPNLTFLSYARLYMISVHGAHGDMAYRAACIMKRVHYDLFNDLFKLSRITLSEHIKRLKE